MQSIDSGGDSASLRILLVTARYVPEIGGTEIHTKELAERLAAAGHEVTVLTTDLRNMLPADEQIGAVRVRRVRARPANRDYYFAPGLASVITEGTWDIVHCQGYHTFVAPIAMLASWRAGIPYIVAFHSGGHSSRLRRAVRGVQRWALRPLLGRAECLVGGSIFEARYFQERLRLPAARFAVIPVGAHLPAVSNADSEPSGGARIISVGRLERYKGHHRVIEALPLVIDQIPDARLHILGDGPYGPALRRLAEEFGVADRVDIAGIPAVDRQGMARALLSASLVISLSEYESAGMSVREALSLGRQTLLTQTSGLAELSTSPLVREICLDSTKEDIAAAIVDQLRRPILKGAALAASWDDSVAAYEAVYRTAVRRFRCAS